MHFPEPTKHKDIEQYLILRGCVFCQSSVMVRKKIFNENNIKYKTECIPAEDYALWLDLIGKTKFAVMEEELIKYRFYHDNISHRQHKQQASKSNEVQYKTLQKYLNLTDDENNQLKAFFLDRQLPKQILESFSPVLEKAIHTLISRGFSEQEVNSVFKKKFKKLYYHTHGLLGQRILFSSPANKLFNLPQSWRIFCFITRGVF
jgi:hypothetical protein